MTRSLMFHRICRKCQTVFWARRGDKRPCPKCSNAPKEVAVSLAAEGFHRPQAKVPD